MFDIYNKQLLIVFDTDEIYEEDEIIDNLKEIASYNNMTYFIIKPDETEFTSNSQPLSNFFKNYTIKLSEKYNGRTYESYGIDIQGATIRLNTSDGEYIAGIQYETASFDTVIFFVVNFIILIILISIVLFYFGKSLSNDLSYISKSLRDIANEKNVHLNNKIPISSNDEVSDLISSFNMVQERTAQHIEQIENSQNVIMEKERLASLGQLVGRNCS